MVQETINIDSRSKIGGIKTSLFMAFVFSIFLFVITGAFCSAVANEKGYNAFWWFILGFLFSFVALIAIAGLPDRKLRKYIRQIGEKQKAIKPEVADGDFIESPSNLEGEIIETSSGATISFIMPTSSNEEQMYRKLLSVIEKSKVAKKKFNKLKVETYEFNESLTGGREFVLLGKDLRTLICLRGKELNAIEYAWRGDF